MRRLLQAGELIGSDQRYVLCTRFIGQCRECVRGAGEHIGPAALVLKVCLNACRKRILLGFWQRLSGTECFFEKLRHRKSSGGLGCR
ncbi:MAG: hypothetical protein M3434_06360 [Gemmatimonadota bacterium]|nr:hypothetical protein [Gemmatimonadota bacterium]